MTTDSTGKVQPYLFFNGRTEEALEFYKAVLDAEIEVLLRFRDSPGPQPGTLPPGSEEKVMHANFRVGETQLMASDGDCGGMSSFQGISLSLTLDSPDEVDRKFQALSQGGQVQMPLNETYFARRFGMVADKFGVPWMLICCKE